MAFGNRRRVLSFGIVSSAQRELGVKILRVLRENGFEFLNGSIRVAGAEIEHGIVVCVLQVHCFAFDKFLYRTIVWAVQAGRFEIMQAMPKHVSGRSAALPGRSKLCTSWRAEISYATFPLNVSALKDERAPLNTHPSHVKTTRLLPF